jgi:hypothetical protein
MRYKAKSVAALQLALGGLPDQMRVEIDTDIGVSAKTVGELRKVTAWPDNLAITTPLERDPESTVKVNKASVATRTSPKPRGAAQLRGGPSPFVGFNDRGIIVVRLVDPRRDWAHPHRLGWERPHQIFLAAPFTETNETGRMTLSLWPDDLQLRSKVRFPATASTPAKCNAFQG